MLSVPPQIVPSNMDLQSESLDLKLNLGYRVLRCTCSSTKNNIDRFDVRLSRNLCIEKATASDTCVLHYRTMADSEQIPITLWGVGTARTLRPIWVAEELGLHYELKPIGPRTGETKTEAYTALNPKQKIPFCEVGSIKISETFAICRYLLAQFGSSPGLSAPGSIEEAAKEDEWLSFIYGELDETSLYVMRRHGALSDIYGEAPEAMASAREYVLRMLQVVEKALDNREFLLRNKFSLADLFLTTCLNWVLSYDIPLASSLRTYRDRIILKPAYQRATEANKPRT